MGPVMQTNSKRSPSRASRAIDFECPECGARPGSPCRGSRIPSAGSLGGGWGGPPARKSPHPARQEVRRAAAARQS